MQHTLRVSASRPGAKSRLILIEPLPYGRMIPNNRLVNRFNQTTEVRWPKVARNTIVQTQARILTALRIIQHVRL